MMSQVRAAFSIPCPNRALTSAGFCVPVPAPRSQASHLASSCPCSSSHFRTVAGLAPSVTCPYGRAAWRGLARDRDFTYDYTPSMECPDGQGSYEGWSESALAGQVSLAGPRTHHGPYARGGAACTSRGYRPESSSPRYGDSRRGATGGLGSL